MTTEIWRVHILWIFQITKITRAKLPIQNCLSGGFQERVGVINQTPETRINTGFSGSSYAPKYTKSTRKYISAYAHRAFSCSIICTFLCGYRWA